MTISFIHRGGPQMASYRYRARIPARALNAQINQFPADILIFAKPLPDEIYLAKTAKQNGSKIVVDFCDDHFDQSHYGDMTALADLVTCSTPMMAERISYPCRVIPDTYEFDELPPCFLGSSLLWFGHSVNAKSIAPFRDLKGLRVVSNMAGDIPWSLATLHQELAAADIVLMPATADYKSPNRTLEAIRMGCFVVAEPHPAINDFPIWIGDIKEGIAWARQNLEAANQMILRAQAYIREKYSPAIQASAWKTALATLN